MIGAGENIMRKGQKTQCGGLWDPSYANGSCEDTVAQKYREYTEGLNALEMAIFEDSYRILMGNSFEACNISQNIPVHVTSSDIGRHVQCTVGFVNGGSTIRFEKCAPCTYEQMLDYLRKRAQGKARLAADMVALPSEFRAYLDTLRAKGDPYRTLAAQAERLFREGLAQVEAKKRAEASLKIADRVQAWAEPLENELRIAGTDKSKQQTTLLKAVVDYVYKVSSSYVPKIQAAPAELFKTDALGFGSGDSLSIDAVAELRRLFVEALIILREIKGNEDVKRLAVKTAEAVKGIKEDDDKVGELGYKLLGYEVVAVELDSSKNVEEVLLAPRPNIADAPHDVVHAFDTRVDPDYLKLMRYARGDIWRQLVDKVGRDRVEGDAKLKKDLANQLNADLEKVPPEKIPLLFVLQDPTKSKHYLGSAPKELDGLIIYSLGHYGVYRKLKQHFFRAVHENPGMYGGMSDAAKEARRELARQIGEAAEKAILCEAKRKNDLTVGAGRFMDDAVVYPGLDSAGKFNPYYIPKIKIGYDTKDFKYNYNIEVFGGGVIGVDEAVLGNSGLITFVPSLGMTWNFSKHVSLVGDVVFLSGVFPKMINRPPRDSSWMLDENEAGEFHGFRVLAAGLGVSAGKFSLKLQGGLVGARGLGLSGGHTKSALWPASAEKVTSIGFGGRAEAKVKGDGYEVAVAGAVTGKNEGITVKDMDESPESEKYAETGGGPVGMGSIRITGQPASWFKAGGAFQYMGDGDNTVMIGEAGVGFVISKGNEFKINYRLENIDKKDHPTFMRHTLAADYQAPMYLGTTVEAIFNGGLMYASKGGELTVGEDCGLCGWGSGDVAGPSAINAVINNRVVSARLSPFIRFKSSTLQDFAIEAGPHAEVYWMENVQGGFEPALFIGGRIVFTNDWLGK